MTIDENRRISKRQRSEPSSIPQREVGDESNNDDPISLQRSQTYQTADSAQSASKPWNPIVEVCNLLWSPPPPEVLTSVTYDDASKSDGSEDSSTDSEESASSPPKSRSPMRHYGMAGMYTPSPSIPPTSGEEQLVDGDKAIESTEKRNNEAKDTTPSNSTTASIDSSASGGKKTDLQKKPREFKGVLFLACFVVVLAAVGVVAYFLAKPEPAMPTTLGPTSSPSTSPTPNPSTVPPSFPPSTLAPSASPTLSFFSNPPLPDDCYRVRNGEAVRGQDFMTARNFDIILDVIMDIRATQNDAMWALQSEFQKNMMPKLLGCGDLPNRRLRHKRKLGSVKNRYVVGNGVVQWRPAPLEKRPECLMCFRAVFNMELFLKPAEEDFVAEVANLVLDTFGENFVDSLQFKKPLLVSALVQSVIYRDPTPAPSTAPSFDPTDTPSRSPSVSPTLKPTSRPTPFPTLRPSTSASPTVTPSATPTRRPTIAPTPNPTAVVTPSPTRAPSSSPTPRNQLVLLGGNQSPSSVYPLRECAGDCDNDNDCGPGLFCFERNALENVPGCIGNGQAMMDYCYNPGSGFERLVFYGNIEYDSYELGQCEGDCDFDSDCEIGMVCYQRESNNNGNVPSCVGNANIVGYGDDDYCIPKPTSNTLMSVFDNVAGADAAAGGMYPIPRCAGDCDSDADCQPGLTCYQRVGFDAVPGCSGTGEADFDYCI